MPKKAITTKSLNEAAHACGLESWDVVQEVTNNLFLLNSIASHARTLDLLHGRVESCPEADAVKRIITAWFGYEPFWNAEEVAAAVNQFKIEVSHDRSGQS